jgi:hypothetical protein
MKWKFCKTNAECVCCGRSMPYGLFFLTLGGRLVDDQLERRGGYSERTHFAIEAFLEAFDLTTANDVGLCRGCLAQVAGWNKIQPEKWIAAYLRLHGKLLSRQEALDLLDGMGT